MVLALACSGGGGGGGSSAGAPTISNFTFYPATAIQNQGGGSVQVSVQLDFVTPGGDGASLLMSEGGQSATVPLSNMAGAASGTIYGALTMDTTQVGSYTFSAQLLTSHGAASNVLSQTFTVTENTWRLDSISPSSVVAGGPGFTLTVTGSGFRNGSSIQWNGNWLSTTYVSATTLQAQIPASNILAAGTVQISVYDSVSGISASLPLTITAGADRAVALPTNDLAWDPARQVIYASIPSSAGAQGNTIAVINPADGSVIRTVFAGSEPGRLAISDDGSYLYAGINGASYVQRFLLPSLAADITIPLGSGPYGAGPNHAIDLVAAPGAPHTLAVTTGSSLTSSSFTGLTIFDDATPRTTSIPPYTGYQMDWIQWGPDATTLFARNGESSGFDLYQMAVGGAGVTMTRDIPSGIGSSWYGGLHYVGSSQILYGDSGGVVNAVTLQQVGTFNQAGPMVPDAALGLAYFLDAANFYGTYCTLKSFDLTRFTPVSSHNVPLTSLAGSGTFPPVPRRILRWGADGLAFGGGGGPLYLVKGAFVTGQ
jgi:hypothetical protein